MSYFFDTHKLGRDFITGIAKGLSESVDKFSFNGAETGAKAANFINEMLNGIHGELHSIDFEPLARSTRNVLWSTSPYFLLSGVVLTGTPLFMNYVYYRYKHAIGRPKLATEIKNITFLTPITNQITELKNRFFPAPKPVAAIFNEKVTQRIENFSSNLHNASKNKGFLPNLVLHGPGGTGKTMIAKQIAEKSNMSYVAMSGGDLAQYIKRGEHVSELNKLMEQAKRKKTILFIDEAESLCKNRDQIHSPEHLELINAFLNHTGVESQNLCIILATNKIEDIDEAVMSRMDYKISVPPPEYIERKEILSTYIARRFSEEDRKAFFSEKTINQIAWNTTHFTGRALAKMINAIANQKSYTEENSLTTELVQKTVEEFIQQEKLYRTPASESSFFKRIFSMFLLF